MTIHQYYKENKNSDIYNKKIAYNILFYIADFTKLDTDFVKNKINSLQLDNKRFDNTKIYNYVINNFDSYRKTKKIFFNFYDLDRAII